MPPLPQPAGISIDEYLAAGELSTVKHEYLGGAVHAMAGATNGHNETEVNALVALGGRLRGKPCLPFNSDTKVRIELDGHTRFYYPDALVVCDPNPRSDHFQDRPVVVIEVLSESTRRIDQGEKCDTYRRIPSLRVLVLAESESMVVTVHRRLADGGFGVEYHAGKDAVIPIDKELLFGLAVPGPPAGGSGIGWGDNPLAVPRSARGSAAHWEWRLSSRHASASH